MFRKIIKGLKDVWCGTLEFDTEPKKDSFNPVTSGGVYDAINGAGGAKEIVYFDIDPSDPPSGIYAAITEALSKKKEPVLKIDGAVYFYTATGTDKYVFVGGYTKEAVGYTEIEVSDDDSVTSKPVDDKVFNMYMLYRTDPASPGDPPGTGDQPGAGYWICDENKHVITKTELMAAHANCRYFVLNNDIEPDSNTRKYFASVTVISNSNIRILFSMIQTDDGSAAEFTEKLVMADSEGRLYVLRSYEIYLAGTNNAVLVSEPQNFDSTQKAQGRANIGAASASDVTALQSQVSSLSDVSAYSVKGEATVAQLNAGPSGIQAGWAYQLTDSGTLTDGSLAVVAGDTVAWDGTKWFPLVRSDYYATKTYAQNVAHSIAPEFDPTRDSEHAYPAGYSVTYTDGKVYTFKVDHYGAWAAADVYPYCVSEDINSVKTISTEFGELLEEVVDSLPDAMKEDGYRVVTGIVWEQGSINSSGEETPSDYAIRSSFIDVTVPSYLDNKSSGSTAAWVRGYAADKSFIGNFQYDNGKMKQYPATSAITDSYNLDFSLYPLVKYIRIVERHNPSDGTTISPDGNKIDVERIVSVPNGVNLSEIIDPINEKTDDIIERLPSVMKDENAVEQEIVWEQGTISSSTGVDESSDYRIRTDFIDVSKKLYLKNEDGNVSVIMRGYAADKSFIDNFSFVDGEIKRQVVWTAGSYYLDFSSFPSVKYVRIIQKYVTDGTTIEPSDNEIEIDGFFETLNDVTFDDILEEAGKKPYSSNDISFVYDVPGGYYTKGFLKLPPNYVQAGKKVPLIVFVHGSGDISSINATSMTSSYNTYYNYLRDCGYAIFDCYPYSSKYSSQAGSSSNTWGLPINRACYKAGIEYVLKNYNVDGSRIFVSCKSLGGLQAMSMFYDETIPVAAIGMLAPEIDQFSVYMGYSSASKKIAAQDLDFSEDVNDVLDFNQGDSVPAGFWDYITANMQKWVGKFAVWCGLDIPNADKPDYYQLIRNTSDKPRKSLNRPVKIWMASDDNSVDYRNIVAFISSLNNGGYIGELRTMPDGTGGHHSVDSDPSALQTTDVTTPLGVHYDTIPTAYYELEKFFTKWR